MCFNIITHLPSDNCFLLLWTCLSTEVIGVLGKAAENVAFYAFFSEFQYVLPEGK